MRTTLNKILSRDFLSVNRKVGFNPINGGPFGRF